MSNNRNLTNDQASSAYATATGRDKSTFDTVKETVADKLHLAAEALHGKTGQTNEQNSALAGYGRQASDILDRSADYIREMDLNQIKTDVQDQVRRNPGRSLAIAGAAGLILGILFRRR